MLTPGIEDGGPDEVEVGGVMRPVEGRFLWKGWAVSEAQCIAGRKVGAIPRVAVDVAVDGDTLEGVVEAGVGDMSKS